MQAGTVCIHAAAVAGDNRVHPIVVSVAVEHFAPAPCGGKADGIIVQRIFVQAADHHDIGARALDPTLERQHAVLVMHVIDRAALSSQCRQSGRSVRA